MISPRILIVEDKIEEADYLQQQLQELHYEVAGVAVTLTEAIELYHTSHPTICIIDIFLSGKPDGVTFAREISEYARRTAVLFLTSNYDNLTFNFAKTTNPYGYLLKPYNLLELQYAIELAVDRQETVSITESDTLFIKRGNVMSRVNIHDIKYVEVEGKYSRIICRNEKFLIQQPLKDLHSQLPSSHFLRIHRNYIININEIIKIDTANNEVRFKDGSTLFFSRRYLDSFLHFFKILK